MEYDYYFGKSFKFIIGGQAVYYMRENANPWLFSSIAFSIADKDTSLRLMLN